MALFIEQKTLSLAQAQYLFGKLSNPTTTRALFLMRASGKRITTKALIRIFELPANQVTAALSGLKEHGVISAIHNAKKAHYYVSEEVAGQFDSIMAPFAGDETLERDREVLRWLLDQGQLTQETVLGKDGCVHTAKD